MRTFKMIGAAVIASAVLAHSVPVLAQDEAVATEQMQERPSATMAEMDWLEGSWSGEGIDGNPAGETFTYAGESQMVGHFWQLDADGGIDFYELITVVPDGESLIMRLKHFTGDLTGWEAKEGSEALEFPLLERGDDIWKFGPVTFTQAGPNRLHVSVKVRMDDGSLGSFDFRYDRVMPIG